MTYDECATWLIDLAAKWRADAARKSLQFAVQRPCAVSPTRIKLAWVVPEFVENQSVLDRLHAIAAVYGVELVHVAPRDYRDTSGRLARLLPYDAVVICRAFAPHIGIEAVPTAVQRDLIHFCDSETLPDLETQIRVWIELAAEELERRRNYESVDEEKFLLALMLRAMLSHSKIGEFSHCTKETALTVIRGRRLNVPAAERILAANSVVHEDKKVSDSLFLWKEHHDGRQYFLNPRRVEEIKRIALPV